MHADGDALLVDKFSICFHGDSPPILGDDFHLVSGHAITRKFALQHLTHLSQIFGRYGMSQTESECFFDCVAGDRLSGFVHRGVVTLQIVRVDNVVRILDEIAIALFAFAQCRLGLLAFGDVPEEPDTAKVFILGALDRRRVTIKGSAVI